jgi:hypothetical protein
VRVGSELGKRSRSVIKVAINAHIGSSPLALRRGRSAAGVPSGCNIAANEAAWRLPLVPKDHSIGCHGEAIRCSSVEPTDNLRFEESR